MDNNTEMDFGGDRIDPGGKLFKNYAIEKLRCSYNRGSESAVG